MELLEVIKGYSKIKKVSSKSNGSFTFEFKNGQVCIAEKEKDTNCYRIFGNVKVELRQDEVKRFVNRYNVGKGALLYLTVCNHQVIGHEIYIPTYGTDISKIYDVLLHMSLLKQHCLQYTMETKDDLVEQFMFFADEEVWKECLKKEPMKYIW